MKKTETTAQKKIKVNALKKPIDLSALDMLHFRTIQTKRKTVDEVNAIREKFPDTLSYESFPRYYWGIKATAKNGKKLAEIWIKSDFFRVCINPSLLNQIEFPFDISERFALYRKDTTKAYTSNIEDYEISKKEILLTPAETLQLLTALSKHFNE